MPEQDTLSGAHAHERHGHDWIIHWAGLYDLLTGLLGRRGDQLRASIADRLKLRPGDRVLDVGSGTGRLALPPWPTNRADRIGDRNRPIQGDGGTGHRQGTHAGHLQPFQPIVEVRGQHRRAGVSWPSSPADRGRRPGTGSAPTAGSTPAPSRPAAGWGLRRRWRGWSGCRRPATVGSPPPVPARPPRRRGRGRLQGVDVGDLPASLTPRPRPLRPGTPPRPGPTPGSPSRLGFWLGCPARPVRSRPAVMVIVDAGLTRTDQRVFGHTSPSTVTILNIDLWW